MNTTTSTTGEYGTIYVNPGALATPWPISLVEFGLAILFCLPGVLNLGAEKSLRQKSSLRRLLTSLAKVSQPASTVWTITRCCFHGAAALKALAGTAPYPLLSDQIYPLAYAVWLYWERALGNRIWIFMVGLTAGAALLGGPNVYLGWVEYNQGKACMYSYEPSAGCLSPDLCLGVLMNNYSCASYLHTYEVCSSDETSKSLYGMLGAISVCLLTVALTLKTILAMFNRQTPIHRWKLAIWFLWVSVVLGIPSVILSYKLSSTPVSLQIGDCRNAMVWESCGDCVSMLSPTSTNGYLSAWASNLPNNWLPLAALS